MVVVDTDGDEDGGGGTSKGEYGGLAMSEPDTKALLLHAVLLLQQIILDKNKYHVMNVAQCHHKNLRPHQFLQLR